MTKYRVFKISINILVFHVFCDSVIIRIPNLLIHILLSIWYTLITLLLGWWGFSIGKPFRDVRNTLEALHINLTGGIDYSKEIRDREYDDKTNYVWTNLLRTTTGKIKKEELEIIIEIQEEYEQFEKPCYTEDNVNFIILNLGKIDIHRITRHEIEDIFDALEKYNEYENNTN